MCRLFDRRADRGGRRFRFRLVPESADGSEGFRSK